MTGLCLFLHMMTVRQIFLLHCMRIPIIIGPARTQLNQLNSEPLSGVPVIVNIWATSDILMELLKAKPKFLIFIDDIFSGCTILSSFVSYN